MHLYYVRPAPLRSDLHHPDGERTTLIMVARLAAFVVAVRPPALPVGTGAPLSATRAAISPLPEPTRTSLVTVPAGAVQLVVVDDLSAQ